MDVASLGLEVESSKVVKATGDLNKLSVAAAQAEANAAKLSRQRMDVNGTHAAARAAQNLAKANEQAGKAAGNLSREEMEALRATRQAANAHAAATRATLERAKAEDILAAAQARSARAALREAQKQRHLDDLNNPRRNPVNDNDRPAAGQGAGAVRANNSNILSQFQDIGVTAAMGMSPLMIALQQGTQLSAVLASMEKPLAGLVAGFTGLFGAISLLTVGGIALVVWLAQMVNWIQVANTVVQAFAGVIQTLAPYLAVAGAAMALLFGPAIISGILSATAFTLGYAAAATYAGAAASVAWLASLGPITAIVGALALVVAAVYTFGDEIKSAIGVDLLEILKVAGNTMIAIFVGAVDGIVASFSRLPAALGDLMIQAANAVIKAVEGMVNAIAELINGFIFKINAAISSLPGWAGGNARLGDVGKVSFGELSNPFAGGAADVGKTIQSSIDAASKTDYMGAIGKGIGDAADYAKGKVMDLSKWLDKVDAAGGKKKKAGGAKGGKTEGEKFSDIVDGAERRIATLQAEYDAIGLTEQASAKLRYEQELLNQAQQKGITLTDAQRQQLSGLAEEMANLEAKTKYAKEAIDFAKDATKGFASDLRQGLADGKSLWEAFGNAAMNVLDKIVDKLLNDVIDALFQTGSAAGGLGGGGGGGFLGGLLSIFGFAKGGAFGRGVKMFANGGAFTNSVVTKPTPFAYGGSNLGIMGEAGDEAVMPLSRDASGKLGVSMIGGGAKGGKLDVHVTAETVMNDNGQLETFVRDIAVGESQKTTAAGIQAFSQKNLPDRVAQINRNPRRRG